ncbi:MAG: hypothetical protein CBARDMAM_3392 [uncultured Caballeronia sp.]|nr:MAG: hypothetical protein CBARDMAM_3392 [uncultured Caballeronia sp.]
MVAFSCVSRLAVPASPTPATQRSPAPCATTNWFGRQHYTLIAVITVWLLVLFSLR